MTTYFHFQEMKSEFESSLFTYKTKISNYVGQDSYIINQYKKRETVNAIKASYAVNVAKTSNTYDISYTGANKYLNSMILNGIVD